MKKNKILACGVPRCGTTLIWQLLKNILPGKVQKAHPGSWHQQSVDFIFGSVRHPYDVAGSWWRTRMVTDDGDGTPNTLRTTREGLIKDLRIIAHNFKVMKEMQSKYSEKIVVLRYEDFFFNLSPLFDIIQNKTGVFVSVPKRKKLIHKYSFEANRKKALQINPGDAWVERMGLSHVALGFTGSWKAVLPIWAYPIMKNFCNPICKEWNYAYSN